jgi:hypothetical protein
MIGIKCINPHEPVTHQDAFHTVDQMSDRENRKLGYSGDEKLLRPICQSFVVNESD